jgi:hypothetical protein
VALLPVAPPPLAGELLGSWVGRLAALYDAPPQYLWNVLAGLPASGFVWDGGRVPWPEQVSRVAAAARLEVRVLAATTRRHVARRPGRLAAGEARIAGGRSVVCSLSARRSDKRAAGVFTAAVGGGLRCRVSPASRAAD